MSDVKRKHHELKTDPPVFEESMNGCKPWEIRRNDRDFREGDTVTLLETVNSGQAMSDGASLEYTGRKLVGIITWVMRGPEYGLLDGWCIFTLAPGFADTAADIDARLQYELEHSCPACGGSGHKDDCQS